jgi:FkbM family methyltransferase
MSEERYRPYPFAGGLIYLDVEDSPTMLARAEGRYEPAKIALIQRFLRPGMSFVDVGANMGDFSLIAAKTMDDEGRVLAFEPSPDNCAWMRRSIELNGYRCISLFEIALSDAGGQEVLYLCDRIGWHSLLPGPFEQETITVVVERLDAVLESTGDPHVDMVKVDVEGAELKVLQGAPVTFGRAAPMMLMIDIHPGCIDPSQVCSLLVEYGFSLRLPSDGSPTGSGASVSIQIAPSIGEGGSVADSVTSTTPSGPCGPSGPSGPARIVAMTAQEPPPGIQPGANESMNGSAGMRAKYVSRPRA